VVSDHLACGKPGGEEVSVMAEPKDELTQKIVEATKDSVRQLRKQVSQCVSEGASSDEVVRLLDATMATLMRKIGELSSEGDEALFPVILTLLFETAMPSDATSVGYGHRN
jgi:hypothetical protein